MTHPEMNEAPVKGDYLTDGTHLYEMDGTDTDGNYYLLDCSLPIQKAAPAPIKVSADELWEGYWGVRSKTK